MTKAKNRYSQIIEKIFNLKHKVGAKEVIFEREDLVHVAKELGIPLPKNLGDIVYSFRYRADLPEYIRASAPEGLEWVIRPVGKARYKFALSSMPRITPSELMVETKIPDATPGIIAKYALSDEQAVLAKLRYNRLVDIFTGVTCYSLQSHLRTTVSGMGQVETDELYVGVDQRGAQYVFPIQAKGGADKLGIIQIEQDFAMCAAKFPALICRPIAALFIQENLIALFAFEEEKNGIAISAEKHYRLVTPEEMTPEDLMAYRNRPFVTF
jgi:hypothetical protein